MPRSVVIWVCAVDLCPIKRTLGLYGSKTNQNHFSGTVSCWGMGTSNQLATGDDEDAVLPVKMGGKQLQNK